MKEEPPRVEEFHGEEEHKPLFPLDWTDYLGFFCASLGLMLAAGGGIGGGGMLVPLYILVMGFSPKHAIPLSNVTVFGGACANFYLNQPKRHPKADRPLMDWDLIHLHNLESPHCLHCPPVCKYEISPSGFIAVWCFARGLEILSSPSACYCSAFCRNPTLQFFLG